MARPLAALLLLTALALAGCSGSESPGAGDGGDGGGGTQTVGGGGSTGGSGGAGSGSASAFLKDAPADDFAELHVLVTAACVHRSGSGSAGTTTTSASPTTTAGNGTTTGNGTGNLTTSATTTSASTTTTDDGDGSGQADPCTGPRGQARHPMDATPGTCAARTATTTSTSATTTTSAAGNGTTTGNGTAGNGTTTSTVTWPTGSPPSTTPGTTTAGTTTAGGWIVLFSDPAGLDVDLLATTGARAAFLGEASLAAGSYQQLRIEVCAAWGITHEGENVTIEVASGTLRSVRSFTVAAGQESRVTVDLDLERSLREQGNGQWRLSPVIGKTTVATVADASSGEDAAEPGDIVPVPEAGDGLSATTTSTTSAAGTTTDMGNTTSSSSSTTAAGTP